MKVIARGSRWPCVDHLTADPRLFYQNGTVKELAVTPTSLARKKGDNNGKRDRSSGIIMHDEKMAYFIVFSCLDTTALIPELSVSITDTNHAVRTAFFVTAALFARQGKGASVP